MNMKKVLDWVKANVLIVVLGVVALASIGLGWFFAGSLNESVRKTAQERAAKMTDLTGLEKSSVTLNIPGKEPETKQVVINQQILDQYKKLVETLKADADKIRALAVSRNRGNHTLLMEGVFPTVEPSMKQTVHMKLHSAVIAAYSKLFADVGAGSPPPAEAVAEDLVRREGQFILSTLRKANREALDPAEKKLLADELSRNRLALYAEQAQRISVYATTDAVGLPADPRGRAAPTPGEMFDWQWRYWIVSDIMHAVTDAAKMANNGEAGTSVLRNPVKRIVQIRVEPAGFAAAKSSSDGGGNAGSGFGGFGAAGGAPAADGQATDPNAPAAAPADPNAPLGTPKVDLATEAARDYTATFTGRQSNAAYDVRRAEVTAIVATAQLPIFFDALAKRNFITVTNVRVEQWNPFADAEAGFVYGKSPVSKVRFDLESVWLREWVAPYMPRDVRAALGITEEPAAPASTS
ncbi:MAG: hypothetical protein JNM94_16595 [Phycisphaerae bacterium]|nr:hypothetical protein [Phycisphaerae bacterium]